MDDTIQYMAERYPDLSDRELQQLRDLGLRFCQPVISRGDFQAPSTRNEADAA